MKTIEYYMNLPYRMENIPDVEEGEEIPEPILLVSSFKKMMPY